MNEIIREDKLDEILKNEYSRFNYDIIPVRDNYVIIVYIDENDCWTNYSMLKFDEERQRYIEKFDSKIADEYSDEIYNIRQRLEKSCEKMHKLAEERKVEENIENYKIEIDNNVDEFPYNEWIFPFERIKIYDKEGNLIDTFYKVVDESDDNAEFIATFYGKDIYIVKNYEIIGYYDNKKYPIEIPDEVLKILNSLL